MTATRNKAQIANNKQTTIRQLQNFLDTIPDYKQTYLRILNDEDRRSHEEAPLGLILCKDADKDYAGYIMQDFRQPMGVATYKTADEMDPEVLKALPPKEELIRLMQDNGTENLIKKS